ncbi:hypothetical protein [Virgibacillus proomii]|uniref:hypothetical protein n=1 Tax=Virgibacillus proomii TaxID=84407 RepID=UPI001C110241|nr:hypothetical protein [Virgibacillus proomii]MBU5266280.1 hypothetical protein [Virgibacillus proomii]
MTDKAADTAREVTAENWGKHIDIDETLTGLKAVQREARKATQALRELQEEQEQTDSMKIDFDSLKDALKSYVETQNKYGGYHDISFDEVFEILSGYNDGNWRISDRIIHATTKTAENGELTYGDDQFVIVRFTNRGGEAD